jgi:hypothetical protein
VIERDVHGGTIDVLCGQDRGSALWLGMNILSGTTTMQGQGHGDGRLERTLRGRQACQLAAAPSDPYRHAWRFHGHGGRARVKTH